MSTYPSVNLAYEMAVAAYANMNHRFDVLESRVDGILKLAISLALAAPVAVAAFELKPDVLWATVAGIAFIIGLICGVSAWLVGGVIIVDPAVLWEKWLRFPEEEFRRNMIYYSGQNFATNDATLRRRYRILYTAIASFGVATLSFGYALF